MEIMKTMLDVLQKPLPILMRCFHTYIISHRISVNYQYNTLCIFDNAVGHLKQISFTGGMLDPKCFGKDALKSKNPPHM